MSSDKQVPLEEWAFSKFGQSFESVQAIGVACSGGGDSIALLRLLHSWAEQRGIRLECATVDHGLRAASVEEAAFVANLCKGLKIRHTVLKWQGWDQKGNLQDQAQRNRYRLLANWANEQNLDAVALGHTGDDAVETFLMRLARGSGVDGLSVMDGQFERHGMQFMRPLLDKDRGQLREYLKGLPQDWIDDPSNENERFDRVKIRKALPVLEGLGIGREKIRKTAIRMKDARKALEVATHKLATKSVKLNAFGAVEIDRSLFLEASTEIQRRLLAHCLQFVSGTRYKIGLTADDPIWRSVSECKTHSVSGCLVAHGPKNTIEVAREPNSMPVSADFDQLYEGRWKITLNAPNPLAEIRPLGEKSLQSFTDWKQLGVSRPSLAATPSIWCKGELLTAPLLDKMDICSCQLVQSDQELFTSIVTH